MSAEQKCESCGGPIVAAGHGQRACARSRCPKYVDAVARDAIVLDFDALASWRPVAPPARPARKDWFKS